MPRLIWRTSIVLAFAMLPVFADAQVYHRDDLDPPEFSPGPWAGQGGWTEWVGSVDVTGTIDTSVFFTGSQSGMIVGSVGGSTGLGDDMVYDYINLPGGQPSDGNQYIVSVMSYVPSAATGTSWVIIVNRYPTNINWSLQVQLQADTGLVHSVQPVGGTDRPLLFDEWVNLVVCIDLAADEVRVYYGENLLVTGAWVGTGGGDPSIAALDLYAGEPGSGGTSGTWFDNHRIERVGTAGQPCAVLNVRPGQVVFGDTINIKTQSQDLPNEPYGLFVWELNGNVTIPRLVFISTLNAIGESNISANIPAGLSGVSVGFKSLIRNPSGPLAKTNTFELVFQ